MHPDLGDAYNTLATIEFNLGRYSESGRHYEQALTIRRDAFADDHALVAQVRNNLGFVARQRGDYALARQLYQDALDVRRAAFGDEDVRVAPNYNALALVLWEMGKHREARPLFEKALAIKRRKLAAGHTDIATSLNNLGLLLRDMGDFEMAEPLFEEALQIRSRSLGSEHPATAQSLHNLGLLLKDMHRLEEAQSHVQRALTTWQATLGDEHIEVSNALSVLADLARRRNRLAAARQLEAKALRIREAVEKPHGVRVASSQTLLGQLELAEGNADAALAHFARSLAILGTSVGNTHPRVASPLIGRGLSERALGNFEAAVSAALRAEAVSRKHLQETGGTLPERQALRYAATRKAGLDLAVSIALEQPDHVEIESIWDAQVRSRALVLDEMASRHRAIATADSSELKALRATLGRATQRVVALTIKGPGGIPADRYRQMVAEANSERETAERTLAEQSAVFRAERSSEKVGLREVKAAVPDTAVVVAFTHYEEVDSADIAGSRPQASYAAFVLGRNREAALIKLASADHIDALVTEWRRAIRQGALGASASSYNVPAAELRRAVWDPLAPWIGDAKQLMIVPDGALSLVNFASLPTDDGEYLAETALFHYLSSERELLQTQGAAEGVGLLAVGGVDFGATVTREPRKAGAFRGTRSACADFRAHVFDDLPATAREIDEIAPLWKSDEAVALLIGAAASEAAFKREAPGKRVIHLATHGFFLDGRCESTLSATRGVGGLATIEEKPRPSPTAESPLLLSGLALAGANHRGEAGPDEEDGILTAEEIAALDLTGLDWAVLSACDTGIGRIQAGEGVLGLRRAFRVAGARTLIMSLWPVDDDAAREWMLALYEARLTKQLSTAESVRSASLRLLEMGRARGNDHPFFWAGFVAAGDWR